MSKRKIFDTAFSTESLERRQKLYKQYHSHYEILDQIDLVKCLNKGIKHSKARNIAIDMVCREKAHIYDKNINDIFLSEKNEDDGKLITLDGLTFEPDRLNFSNINENNNDLSEFQPKSMFGRANKYAKYFSKLAWRKYQRRNIDFLCKSNSKVENLIKEKCSDHIEHFLNNEISIQNIVFQVLISCYKESATGTIVNDVSEYNMDRLKIFADVMGINIEENETEIFVLAVESIFSKKMPNGDEEFYRLLLNCYWYFETIALEQCCANMNQSYVFFDNTNEASFVGKILMRNNHLDPKQWQHIYFTKKENGISDYVLKFWIELEFLSENNSGKHKIRNGTMRAVFALQKDNLIEVIAIIELDIVQPVWVSIESDEINQSPMEALAYTLSEKIEYYDQIDTPEMRTLFQRILPDYGYYKKEIIEAMHTNEKYLVGKAVRILSDRKYDDLILGELLEYIDSTVVDNEEMNGCMLYGSDIKRYYNFGRLFCVIINREKLIERNQHELRSMSLDNGVPLENVYNRICGRSLPVLVCEEYGNRP